MQQTHIVSLVVEPANGVVHQSLPVNQSDFVHSTWNDFIELSGCHFTHSVKKKKLILAPGANEKRKLLDSLNTPLLQHVTPKLTAQFTERLYLVITKMPWKRNLEHLAKDWKSVIDEIN